MNFETPVPTGTATHSPPPIQNQIDNSGVGGGTWAFLVIVGLILVSVLLFWAMNRSLRRARRNLGGEQLPRRGPRRPRPVIPVRDDDEGGEGRPAHP